MDTIEFRIVTKEHGYEKLECDVVDIFINGKNFLDTVKNFEKSIGYKDEDHYCQITPDYLYFDLTANYKDDFIFIYDCICGCDGCDPFCVFVDVGEKIVTWYDFMTSDEYFDDVCSDNNFAKLKNRLKTKGGLSPLVFDKKQYFEAVNVLRDWMSDNI